jgi:hypothetical protein
MKKMNIANWKNDNERHKRIELEIWYVSSVEIITSQIVFVALESLSWKP